MKEIYVFLFVSTISFTFLTNNSYSQAEKGDHEIGFGIGFLSLDEIYGTASGDVGRTIISFGTESTANAKLGGALAFSYKHFIKNRMAVGLSVIADKVTGDLVNSSDVLTGTFKRNYFTVAPELKWLYKNKEAYRFYGLLGAGITFGSEDIDRPPGTDDESNNWTHFNFQITPLGFRFGKAFGINVELGFGYKGILAGGIGYQF